MSLNTLLMMGIRPLGDFPAGALIAGIGAPGTVLLSASLVGIYGLLLAMRPAVRSTEPGVPHFSTAMSSLR